MVQKKADLMVCNRPDAFGAERRQVTLLSTDQSETVEFSIDRIFEANKAVISAEGRILMSKLGERLRERGLTKMFIRIAGKVPGLSAQREAVLVSALEKSLLLPAGQIEHDNTRPTLRGEIVAVWLKKTAEAGK